MTVLLIYTLCHTVSIATDIEFLDKSKLSDLG